MCTCSHSIRSRLVYSYMCRRFGRDLNLDRMARLLIICKFFSLINFEIDECFFIKKNDQKFGKYLKAQNHDDLRDIKKNVLEHFQTNFFMTFYFEQNKGF